jgi:hypothetical protein
MDMWTLVNKTSSAKTPTNVWAATWASMSKGKRFRIDWRQNMIAIAVTTLAIAYYIDRCTGKAAACKL